jgi:hypothetical protein
VKRVHVLYGGNDFLIGDRDADEVEQEIEAALTAGRPGWLTVNYGEGRPTRCRLLLTPGVDIAVFQTSTDS